MPRPAPVTRMLLCLEFVRVSSIVSRSAKRSPKLRVEDARGRSKFLYTDRRSRTYVQIPIISEKRRMSKEDSIEVTGTVVEKFPSGQFSVQLDQDRIILGAPCGTAAAKSHPRACRRPSNPGNVPLRSHQRPHHLPPQVTSRMRFRAQSTNIRELPTTDSLVRQAVALQNASPLAGNLLRSCRDLACDAASGALAHTRLFRYLLLSLRVSRDLDCAVRAGRGRRVVLCRGRLAWAHCFERLGCWPG